MKTKKGGEEKKKKRKREGGERGREREGRIFFLAPQSQNRADAIGHKVLY